MHPDTPHARLRSQDRGGQRCGVAALGGARPAELRDHATLATTVLAAEAGVWGVRVHDAAASVDAIATVTAVRAARGAGRG